MAIDLQLPTICLFPPLGRVLPWCGLLVEKNAALVPSTASPMRVAGKPPVACTGYDDVIREHHESRRGTFSGYIRAVVLSCARVATTSLTRL